MTAEEVPWWRDAVLYQIYPRSWADSIGDGVGDLRGVIERLDYLEWLGVDGIWLNPITESPNADWGYDVSNYQDVHRDLGTLEDVDELIAAAGRRNIRIIMDIVPNHTSDEHPWFKDARSGRDARYRDFYVWADPRPDGSPPNNWLSVFGGEGAWEFHEPTGQFYLHNFLKQQPDLNWWNEEVADAFDDILRFWFDRDVAGFRIDVAHALVKDKLMRDNPPATPDDHPSVRRLGQRPQYNMNRPETHEVYRRWRRLCDSYDPKRILIGETYVLDLERMAAFYGKNDDELNLAFNFPFGVSPFEMAELRRIVEDTDKLVPQESWPVWMASNHDIGRFPTRWCENDDSKTRCALMLILTLKGTAFLYYGDEIGMPAVQIPEADLQDPVGKRTSTKREGRDPGRTPMQWSAEEGAGFTGPGVRPWLPFGDVEPHNVRAQKGDPASILNLCRDLIALRRKLGDLRRGPYATMTAPDGGWAWRRGATVVAINPSEHPISIDGVRGAIAISTGRERDGERVAGTLALPPGEGAVVVP